MVKFLAMFDCAAHSRTHMCKLTNTAALVLYTKLSSVAHRGEEHTQAPFQRYARGASARTRVFGYSHV